jgi:hypothetical protein
MRWKCKAAWPIRPRRFTTETQRRVRRDTPTQKSKQLNDWIIKGLKTIEARLGVWMVQCRFGCAEGRAGQLHGDLMKITTATEARRKTDVASASAW